MTSRTCSVASVLAALALLPSAGNAVELYDEFPGEIRADERYVVYSHGLIVEGDDPRPVHPELGVYDFPAVAAALFDGGGFNMIAHHRPKNTDTATYVDTLESWVERLMTAGVAPERITLVGFSRGAQLTASAASRLRSSGIGSVLMAVCSDGDLVRAPPIELGGRVLSIYETTDVVGSCRRLAKRSDLRAFEEVAISTGKGHGAFYLPRPEWLQPLKDWLRRTNR